MLNRAEFLRSFSIVWKKRIAEDRDALYANYSNSTTWTDYFLSSTHGVLKEIADGITMLEPEMSYQREVYTIDALFVGGPPLFGTHLGYPSRLIALIEHENNDRIEEEMWKLLFWRAPLKVLICYDWNEAEKTTTARKFWLEAKIELLDSMMSRVAQFIGEDPRTEYLLLVANRTNNGMIQWRWSEIEGRHLHALEGA